MVKRLLLRSLSMQTLESQAHLVSSIHFLWWSSSCLLSPWIQLRSPTPLQFPPEPQSSTTARGSFKQGSGSMQASPLSCWTVPRPKPGSNSLSSGAPGAGLFCPFIGTVLIRRYCHQRVGNPPQDTISRIMCKKRHRPGEQRQPEQPFILATLSALGFIYMPLKLSFSHKYDIRNLQSVFVSLLWETSVYFL